MLWGCCRGAGSSQSLFSGAVQLWWSSLSLSARHLPQSRPQPSVPSPVTRLPRRERGCGRLLHSGSVEICPALAVAEGLEAAGSDELGRSDCIPGRALCLARSAEARGKAGVLRPRASAFATGIHEIQITLQSNLRWPGREDGVLVLPGCGGGEREVGGSALDAKAAGGCAVWAPAATMGTNPPAAPPGLGRGIKPSVFLLQ